MSRIVFLPVGFAEAADRIVDLVERGVLQVQQHWLSREACQAFIDCLPGSSGERNWYRPVEAVLQIAEDCGERGLSLPSGTARCCAGLGDTSTGDRHAAA